MAFGTVEGILEPAATATDVANVVVNVTTGSNRSVTNSMLGRKAAEGARTPELLGDVVKNTVTSHPVVAVGMGSYAATTGVLNDDPDQIGEGVAAVSGAFSYARAIGNPAYSVNVRVRGLPTAPPHIARQRGAIGVPEINIRRINNQYSGKTPHTENVIGRNNRRYNEALQERITNRRHTPTRSPAPLDSPNARQVPTGRFPLTGEKPNAILYRADHDGSITSYATYDSNGMILKRVDMKGAPHLRVKPPHVIEYGRNNKAPDGKVRVQSPDRKIKPRKPLPNELQYYKP